MHSLAVNPLLVYNFGAEWICCAGETDTVNGGIFARFGVASLLSDSSFAVWFREMAV